MGPQYEQKSLSPLASLIVDRAIENTNRKLIAGFRNKNNSRPNAKTSDPLTTGKDTLAATSSQSAMDVANRGVAWKEILLKSLSAGIGSLATLQFDGEINLSAANTADASKLPDKPGVYVVYDASGNLAYIGDSTNMRQRWQDGHLNDHRNGNKKGEPYKLSEQLEAGCKIKFITMDSAETAAALEAHLIKTGKLYVGKADGESGIWGRWCTYAATTHGGNVALKEEFGIDAPPDRQYHLRFSVLEVTDLHAIDKEIDARENHWKQILLSRDFGYNRN